MQVKEPHPESYAEGIFRIRAKNCFLNNSACIFHHLKKLIVPCKYPFTIFKFLRLFPLISSLTFNKVDISCELKTAATLVVVTDNIIVSWRVHGLQGGKVHCRSDTRLSQLKAERFVRTVDRYNLVKVSTALSLMTELFSNYA